MMYGEGRPEPTEGYDEDATEGPSYGGPERSPARRRGASASGGMEQVEKQVMRLSELVSRLDDRLTPVLGPDRPTPAIAGLASQDVPETSPMVRWLDETSERLGHTAGRLQYLLDRVEL